MSSDKLLNMSVAAPESVKRTCFIISPIGKDGSETRKAADQVLKHLIRKSLGDEYVIKRGDEESNPGSITAQIIESILEADLVIADLTGFNPNVYYEVAVAHGYNRPTVHIQQADEKPAFDLQDMRLVRYNLQDPDEIEKSQKALKDFATFVLTTPEKAKTPLAHAERFVRIADSLDPVAQSNAEVIDQLRSLRAEVRRALPRPQTSGSRSAAVARTAHIASLRKIVERAAKRGALVTQDFGSVITMKTSEKFDEWARRTLGEVSGESDPDVLNEILFDDEVSVMASEAEEE